MFTSQSLYKLKTHKIESGLLQTHQVDLPEEQEPNQHYSLLHLETPNQSFANNLMIPDEGDELIMSNNKKGNLILFTSKNLTYEEQEPIEQMTIKNFATKRIGSNGSTFRDDFQVDQELEKIQFEMELENGGGIRPNVSLRRINERTSEERFSNQNSPIVGIDEGKNENGNYDRCYGFYDSEMKQERIINNMVDYNEECRPTDRGYNFEEKMNFLEKKQITFESENNYSNGQYKYTPNPDIYLTSRLHDFDLNKIELFPNFDLKIDHSAKSIYNIPNQNNILNEVTDDFHTHPISFLKNDHYQTNEETKKITPSLRGLKFDLNEKIEDKKNSFSPNYIPESSLNRSKKEKSLCFERVFAYISEKPTEKTKHENLYTPFENQGEKMIAQTKLEEPKIELMEKQNPKETDISKFLQNLSNMNSSNLKFPTTQTIHSQATPKQFINNFTSNYHSNNEIDSYLSDILNKKQVQEKEMPLPSTENRLTKVQIDKPIRSTLPPLFAKVFPNQQNIQTSSNKAEFLTSNPEPQKIIIDHFNNPKFELSHQVEAKPTLFAKVFPNQQNIQTFSNRDEFLTPNPEPQKIIIDHLHNPKFELPHQVETKPIKNNNLNLTLNKNDQLYIPEYNPSNDQFNKIAASFQEIAASIRETINKHKVEIEKDCDLNGFKQLLNHVREKSNEKIKSLEKQRSEKIFESELIKLNINNNNFMQTNGEKLRILSPTSFKNPEFSQAYANSCTNLKGTKGLCSGGKSLSCEKKRLTNNTDFKSNDDSYNRRTTNYGNNFSMKEKRDSRNFLERCAQDLQRRKMQTFKNDRIKNVKYFEEINNIEEINRAKGKLTKNASNQLVKKLMFDAERRQKEKEIALAAKRQNDIMNAKKLANQKYINTTSKKIIFQKNEYSSPPISAHMNMKHDSFKKNPESNKKNTKNWNKENLSSFSANTFATEKTKNSLKNEETDGDKYRTLEKNMDFDLNQPSPQYEY